MRVDRLAIEGAVVLTPERRADERGWFSRLFDRDVVAAAGLDATVAQASVAHSDRRGTLRGMHLQLRPSEETKLVRCVRGRVFDAIADTRQGSPTFGRAAWLELDAEVGQVMCVPPGVAHGYYTLEDDSTVVYLMSAAHDPQAERGVHWGDPRLAIPWPGPVEAISAKDAAWPELGEGWSSAPSSR